jgi:eukaryotic-like serine/threonine-protein kinase
MALDTRGELLAGRYRRLRTIGAGGMARVHLAEDERLGRRVAIKQLHADSPDDAALRFQREARLGASLNHSNLVSVYDIETEGESVLIVMEYVEGQTLQDAIAGGPLPAERVVRIVRDIAAGLDHAHAHGVVHRDVKPANVLIRRDGMAKLADLGIATAAEGTAITRSGIVMGTASYMAPEQLEGRAAGPRTDVYALAAVAFEALSGRKARGGRTPVEVAHEVVNGPPPELAGGWPDAPRAAAAALTRGLARDPADRPATAGTFAAELQRGLAPRRPSTVADPTLPMRAVVSASRRRRPPRRLPAAAAVALLALLAIAGVAVLGGAGDGGPTRDSASRRAAPAKEPPSPETPAPAAVSDSSATDDPVALNDDGYALMRSGRYDEAIPLLERAVAAYDEGSQDLTYAYALYNLGRSLRLAGRPREAVPILERRLEIPNQTDTVQRELDAARAAAG